MNIEQKINLFAGQMLCANPVYTWQYDADLRLLQTNCPDSGIFAEAFDLFGCKDALAAYVKKNRLPIMLSDPAGLVWAAALRKMERAKALLTTTDLSIQDIAVRLQFCAAAISARCLARLWAVHRQLPDGFQRRSAKLCGTT